MTCVVIKKSKILKLCQAAANMQSLLDNGTLGEAFGKGDDRAVDLGVAGFDALKATVAEFDREFPIASPFIRYRREIFGDYETAGRLRALIMNLWGGRPANLSLLFHNADEHHTRIALEFIVRFTEEGENDTYFMDVAAEISELPSEREVAA